MRSQAIADRRGSRAGIVHGLGTSHGGRGRIGAPRRRAACLLRGAGVRGAGAGRGRPRLRGHALSHHRPPGGRGPGVRGFTIRADGTLVPATGLSGARRRWRRRRGGRNTGTSRAIANSSMRRRVTCTATGERRHAVLDEFAALISGARQDSPRLVSASVCAIGDNRGPCLLWERWLTLRDWRLRSHAP
jgi:hypothetical protein